MSYLTGRLPQDQTCGADGCREPAHRVLIVDSFEAEIDVEMPICLRHARDLGLWPQRLGRRGGAT